MLNDDKNKLNYWVTLSKCISRISELDVKDSIIAIATISFDKSHELSSNLLNQENPNAKEITEGCVRMSKKGGPSSIDNLSITQTFM